MTIVVGLLVIAAIVQGAYIYKLRNEQREQFALIIRAFRASLDVTDQCTAINRLVWRLLMAFDRIEEEQKGKVPWHSVN